MKLKLTLNIEKSIIEKVKFRLKAQVEVYQKIIENYLETITQEQFTNKLSPKLKKIVGVVNLPKDFDEKKAIRSVLEQKHL